MKIVHSAMLVLFLALSSAHAAAPFIPEIADRFEKIEDKKMLRVVYDTSVGSQGSSTVNSGVHSLGAYLPAKAIITRSYLYVVTQFADSGAGTVALHCEDANNIKTATDITGSSAGALIEGQSTGAASAFVGSIAAECEVKATVAGASQTAGKLVAFIEYVVGM